MTRSSSVMRGVVLAAVLLIATVPARAQSASGQRLFDSPEVAAKAAIAAAKADDDKAMLEIFGAKHADLIVSSDRAHRESRAQFVKSAEDYLILRSEGDGRVTVVIGFDASPFPIPLVKAASGWRFDTDAGREELLNRRIGANELAVIETLRAYAAGQREYASKPRDGSNVRQFARNIRSTPGRKDGLYWPADSAKGEEASPFGPLIGDAARGRRPGDAYHGYHFKILTRQGAMAPAGRYDYVINGRMIAGFAMVAFPAQYGLTGIKTFVVNHYGIVYESDLGPDTAKLAPAMTEYNPTSAWKPAED